VGESWGKEERLKIIFGVGGIRKEGGGVRGEQNGSGRREGRVRKSGGGREEMKGRGEQGCDGGEWGAQGSEGLVGV